MANEPCPDCHGKRTKVTDAGFQVVTEYCRTCVTVGICKRGHQLITFYGRECPLCLLIMAQDKARR